MMATKNEHERCINIIKFIRDVQSVMIYRAFLYSPPTFRMYLYKYEEITPTF